MMSPKNIIIHYVRIELVRRKMQLEIMPFGDADIEIGQYWVLNSEPCLGIKSY